jgi:hypothetical protein
MRVIFNLFASAALIGSVISLDADLNAGPKPAIPRLEKRIR